MESNVIASEPDSFVGNVTLFDFERTAACSNVTFLCEAFSCQESKFFMKVSIDTDEMAKDYKDEEIVAYAFESIKEEVGARMAEAERSASGSGHAHLPGGGCC